MPFVPDKPPGRFVPDPPPAPAPPAPGLGQQIGRQLGLAARIVPEVVGALPLVAADAGVATRNLITGSQYEMPSAMFSRSLDEIFPKRETGLEKAVGVAGGMLLGAKIPVPQLKAPAPATFAANDAVSVLAREGVPTTAAQRGSRVMQSISRSADTMIGESSFAGRQREAYNAAILRRLGVDAKNAGPDVQADIATALSAAYKQIHAVPTRFDAKLTADLGDFVKSAERTLSPAQRRPFMAQIENIFEQAKAGGGEIPGETAQNIRTELGTLRVAKSAAVRRAATQLQRVMDDAYERHAGPELSALSRATRKRYQQSLIIGKSVDPFGNISPKKFYSQAVKPHNKGAGFEEIATAGRQVLPDNVGNSGTATRTADVGKIIGAIQHPRELLKLLAAIAGGRTLNEAQMFARPMPPQVAATLATGLLRTKDAVTN